MFEHTRRETRTGNRVRQVLLAVVLLPLSILMFPFTLLALFLRGLWSFANQRSLAR